MKFILALLFLTSCVEAKEEKYYLAICSIFQDDAKYLPEWIEFHEKQGVDHFYLYNNLSTDDYKVILHPYVKLGLVDIIEWPFASKSGSDWNTIQCDSYMDCIYNHCHDCRWIAFIDTDEFLFSPKGYPLPYLLTYYQHYAGVSVNWVMYGNGGVERLKNGELLHVKLLYRSLLSEDVNRHVKTIVQTKYVMGCQNPHFFQYIKGKHAVTENRKSIDGPFSKSNSVELFRINHYWQRDKEFFWTVKAKRRSKWYGSDAKEIENLYNDVYDDILIRF